MDQEKVKNFITQSRAAGISDDQIYGFLQSKNVVPPLQQSQPEQVQPTGEKGLQGVATGMAKGLVKTTLGAGELLQNIGTGFTKAILPRGAEEFFGVDEMGIDVLNKDSKVGSRVRGLLKPQGGAEKLGFGAEQIAEYVVPATKVSKLQTGAGALTKVGGQVASDVAVTAAQTGGETREMRDAAIISALFPAAGKVVGGVSEFIKSQGKDFAPRLINSLIKPVNKVMSFGKDPGRAIAEEGIIADSFDDLVQKVSQRKGEIGGEIGELTNQATREGKLLDLTDAITPIDEAIQKAKKSPRTNATLINRLENVKADLITNRNLLGVTPDDAFIFKDDVSAITKFTDSLTDDDIVNGALTRVYGRVKGKINNAIGNKKSASGNTIEKLQEKYGDLTSAEIAAKNRDIIEKRSNVISLPANIVGIGGAILTAISTGGAAIPALLVGAGGVGLEKALSTPKVKTKVAAWLAKATPEEKKALFDAVPALRGAIINMLTD
jgi:hypothetical protein